MDLPQPQQFRQQSFSSSDPHIKRTKERSVAMAQQLVIIWRNYYENGEITDLGHQHLSLQDAANKVGIPKKTLEDYYAIFRKLEEQGINISEYKHQKMGTLRALLRNTKSQQRPRYYTTTLNYPQTGTIQGQVKPEDLMATENYGELILEDQEFCSPGLYAYQNLPDDLKIRKTISVVVENKTWGPQATKEEEMEYNEEVKHEE